jgi:hypothetical protein
MLPLQTMTLQAERDVMGLMLTTNAQTVADVLHRSGEDTDGSVVAAIAATRSLSVIVDDTMRALVAQARAEGRTWNEIGQVLRVTRQAAFQRFGSAEVPAESASTRPLKQAAKRTSVLLADFLAGHWNEVEKDFTPKMRQVVPREMLVATKARVDGLWGPLIEEGTALVTVVDGFTVVYLPLKFEIQAASCRAVFSVDGQVAGLLLSPTGGDGP